LSGASGYDKRQMRKAFRRRSAIEPIIGHLKSDLKHGQGLPEGNNWRCHEPAPGSGGLQFP
jgi:hypothetical protein